MQNKNVRITLERPDLFSRRAFDSARQNEIMKSIRLNPNIPLAREICADSAGYAPQALVPLYIVNSCDRWSQALNETFYFFNHGHSVPSGFPVASPQEEPAIRSN